MKEGTEVQRKVQIYFAFVYVVVPANAVSGVGQMAPIVSYLYAYI